MLELQGVSVHYGDVQALWDVSFTVPEGEIVALVGANGAGKTTTLRTISRLLRPSAGRVSFAGRPMESLQSHQVVGLGIAHVPEGRQLFPSMTVEEHLLLGSFLPAARKERQATLARVYGLFPILRERRQQLAGTLSGGQQQMLAIGRGLMLRPRLLMLDEASLGLAPVVAQEILEVVRQIRDEGVTVLLVEQNVHHALAIADHGVVLENGRVALAGKASELLGNDHIRQAYLGM